MTAVQWLPRSLERPSSTDPLKKNAKQKLTGNGRSSLPFSPAYRTTQFLGWYVETQSPNLQNPRSYGSYGSEEEMREANREAFPLFSSCLYTSAGSWMQLAVTEAVISVSSSSCLDHVGHVYLRLWRWLNIVPCEYDDPHKVPCGQIWQWTIVIRIPIFWDFTCSCV